MSTAITTDGPVSPNGSKPVAAAPSAAEAVATLRRKPRNLHLAGGFGPLIVGAILFLLMLWAAPSVAPEHVVQRPAPVKASAVTTTTAPSAPTTQAPVAQP